MDLATERPSFVDRKEEAPRVFPPSLVHLAGEQEAVRRISFEGFRGERWVLEICRLQDRLWTAKHECWSQRTEWRDQTWSIHGGPNWPQRNWNSFPTSITQLVPSAGWCPLARCICLSPLSTCLRSTCRCGFSHD